MAIPKKQIGGLKGDSLGGKGIGSGGGAARSVPKPAKVPVAKSLKETGLAKLAKAGRTTSEGDIGYALRHGKITQQEAAAIDPKKFPLPVKSKTYATFDLKTGKVTKGK